MIWNTSSLGGYMVRDGWIDDIVVLLRLLVLAAKCCNVAAAAASAQQKTKSRACLVSFDVVEGSEHMGVKAGLSWL